MMEGVRSIISQPAIRLHTMPGEFGIPLFSVRAWQSIMVVAGWEVGNTFRMKYAALREGRIPIQTSVHLRMRTVGGQLTAVGGKSVARVIEVPREPETLENIARVRGVERGEDEGRIGPNGGPTIDQEDFMKITRLSNLVARLQRFIGEDGVLSNAKAKLANLVMLAITGMLSEYMFKARLEAIENTIKAISMGKQAQISISA